MTSGRRGPRPPAQPSTPSLPYRRALSRRTLLKGMLVSGIVVPGAGALLSSCAAENTSVTATELIIAAPTNPVRWPLSKNNPAIESGLTPEPGSTLRIYNYADYLAPAVIKAFQEEYDVEIRLSTFNDSDEALTKIASEDLGIDLYFPSYDQLGRLVQADLLRPLNQDYVGNADNLWREFLDPWYDRGWRYSVPYTVYTTGIGWRTDMIGEDIAARANPYDVFWDSTYAGELAVIDDWHTTMGMVLLANDVLDINTTDPADIALMREQLLAMQEQTTPRVTISMYNDLPGGQFGLSLMWSGDIVNAQYYLPRGESPDVLRYWFPGDATGQVDNDLMVVMAQGDNPVAAHYFINYLLDAEVATRNFGFTGYQPPQRSLTPSQLVTDGYLPANLETAAVLPGYFQTGARLLQLPFEADLEYHQIWQEFKAGA